MVVFQAQKMKASAKQESKAARASGENEGSGYVIGSTLGVHPT